jgi:hypothetical protein
MLLAIQCALSLNIFLFQPVFHQKTTTFYAHSHAKNKLFISICGKALWLVGAKSCWSFCLLKKKGLVVPLPDGFR